MACEPDVYGSSKARMVPTGRGRLDLMNFIAKDEERYIIGFLIFNG